MSRRRSSDLLILTRKDNKLPLVSVKFKPERMEDLPWLAELGDIVSQNRVDIVVGDGGIVTVPVYFLIVLSPFVYQILQQDITCSCSLPTIFIPSASKENMTFLKQLFSEGGTAGILDVTKAGKMLVEVQDLLSLLGVSEEIKMSFTLNVVGQGKKMYNIEHSLDNFGDNDNDVILIKDECLPLSDLDFQFGSDAEHSQVKSRPSVMKGSSPILCDTDDINNNNNEDDRPATLDNEKFVHCEDDALNVLEEDIRDGDRCENNGTLSSGDDEGSGNLVKRDKNRLPFPTHNLSQQVSHVEVDSSGGHYHEAVSSGVGQTTPSDPNATIICPDIDPLDIEGVGSTSVELRQSGSTCVLRRVSWYSNDHCKRVSVKEMKILDDDRHLTKIDDNVHNDQNVLNIKNSYSSSRQSVRIKDLLKNKTIVRKLHNRDKITLKKNKDPRGQCSSCHDGPCGLCDFRYHKNLKKKCMLRKKCTAVEEAGTLIHNSSEQIDQFELETATDYLTEDKVKRVSKSLSRRGCERCVKPFINSWHFQRHLLVHTGEKPFECETCNYKSSTMGNLKRHSLVHDHTEKKPFVCEICTNKFGRKEYLKQHMRRVHDEDYM